MTTSRTSPADTDRSAELAYAMSHDLRARLRAASGFLELARVDLHESVEAAYFLGRAAAAAELADRMVERLVRYLRIPLTDDVEVVDPAQVIREVADRCLDGPETVVDSLPDVMGNHDLLAVAAAEILDNAARYRSEGRPPAVRVSATVEGPWAVIRFADNGAGVPADRVDRAFGFFRQVHRVGDNPGSGMGLPIARRSIEAQGGTVTLRPGSDIGAVVDIRLPTPPGA